MFLIGTAHAAETITVGSLTLTKCIQEYNGYCGTIAVPLDRHQPETGRLTVGFEFYPHVDASMPSSGVILAQEGGPGFSTTGSRDGYVRLLEQLRDTRDILLIDKRGTGRSSPINCPALQQAYLPTQLDIAACAQQLGRNAWFYRSADAADDVADVMSALGFATADYYGDSYGTWFGQVLAVRHPHLLRTIVLDSAYPVLNDASNSEVNHGQEAMDLVCARSTPCRALGASATARFAGLLASLRAAPVSGTAPGAGGEQLTVTANPAGLFLIVANAGNAPTAWRDLDAAGRAWMQQQDALPLLRLVAEARDSYSGGGSPVSFSVGLADAVQCAEYGEDFNIYATLDKRLFQYHDFLHVLRTREPDAFAPFAIDDAIGSQMDVESYDTCLTWPRPAKGVIPARPVPPNAVFPPVPVLVLSGELDTVTSPSEGKATAALFPHATFIETRNLTHESAIADEGYFVSPLGEDLPQCIGPIVRRFMRSGGDTGSTACVAHIRPIRTVPIFAARYAQTPPATPADGNEAGATGLVLASAAAETVGDAVARYYVTTSGQGAGLRGGRFTLSPTSTGYKLHLHDAAWAQDLTVSGTIDWDQNTGLISAKVSLSAPGHTGTLSISWNDNLTEATATLTGTIDGEALVATRIAP